MISSRLFCLFATIFGLLALCQAGANRRVASSNPFGDNRVSKTPRELATLISKVPTKHFIDLVLDYLRELVTFIERQQDGYQHLFSQEYGVYHNILQNLVSRLSVPQPDDAFFIAVDEADENYANTTISKLRKTILAIENVQLKLCHLWDFLKKIENEPIYEQIEDIILYILTEPHGREQVVSQSYLFDFVWNAHEGFQDLVRKHVQIGGARLAIENAQKTMDAANILVKLEKSLRSVTPYRGYMCLNPIFGPLSKN